MPYQLRILILVGVGISLLYSLIRTIVLRMPGRNREAARKRMAEAQWFDADSRDGAFVRITGTVKTKEPGDRFVSPLSEKRCVALHLRALARRGRRTRGEMVETLQLKQFVLDGEGSKIVIDATHGLLDLPPARPPKTADAHKLLVAVGKPDANTSTSRVEETVVEIGVTVTIAGTLVRSPELKLVGDEANPIVICQERQHADIANEP
jgi:hypothetical protein